MDMKKLCAFYTDNSLQAACSILGGIFLKLLVKRLLLFLGLSVVLSVESVVKEVGVCYPERITVCTPASE